MNCLSNCQFYCLSFNNEERKNNMIWRFNKLNVSYIIYDGVENNDDRIIEKKIDEIMIREVACCYSHLDMIYNFYYKTHQQYAIFCEDDIHIHKDLIEILPKIITDFNILNLDILLLGYLTPFVVNENMTEKGFSLKRKPRIKTMYTYHNYPEELSGTHMYMLSRKHAKTILNKYYNNCEDPIKFTRDNILIKDGNRALISPVLAVEEKKGLSNFHLKCHNVQYNYNKFI